MIRIAEVLLELQKAGNVTYSGWKVSFDCATYIVAYSGELEEEEVFMIQKESAEQRVKELEIYAKKMEKDLYLWRKEVKKSRSRHYELNYYTTLQLLRLRKELGLVHQNPTKVVDPQILALLESISPKVTSIKVQNIISSLKKELLDLRLLTPNEVLEPADFANTEDPGDAPIKNVDLCTALPTAMEVPSMTPSEKPHLSESDLTDSQKKILTDLVEYKYYSKLLVLKAFEQLPPTSNLYDIQDWCDEFESMHDLENEEEGLDQKSVTSNGDSSDSEVERIDVFDKKSQSGWCYSMIFMQCAQGMYSRWSSSIIIVNVLNSIIVAHSLQFNSSISV